MIIDDLTPRDLAAVAAIYDDEVRHGVATFDTEVRTEAGWRAWMAEHAPDRYPVLVARQGEVLGWAALSSWSTRCAYARAAEVSVYVDAAARGRGVGRRLLAALAARAPTVGVSVLLARIESSQAVSLKLHRALGFQEVGVMRRVGFKHGRLLDVVLMDRHLDLETA